MVQMKADAVAEVLQETISFISHMVQMKVEFQPMKLLTDVSLYPTWFR